MKDDGSGMVYEFILTYLENLQELFTCAKGGLFLNIYSYVLLVVSSVWIVLELFQIFGAISGAKKPKSKTGIYWPLSKEQSGWNGWILVLCRGLLSITVIFMYVLLVGAVLVDNKNRISGPLEHVPFAMEKSKVDVTIFIDTSLSMLDRNKDRVNLEQTKEFLSKFLEQMDKDSVSVKILLFAEELHTLVPRTRDVAFLMEKVREISVGVLGDGTKIMPVIKEFHNVVTSAEKERHQVILLISDGIFEDELPPMENMRMEDEKLTFIAMNFSKSVGKLESLVTRYKGSLIAMENILLKSVIEKISSDFKEVKKDAKAIAISKENFCKKSNDMGNIAIKTLLILMGLLIIRVLFFREII
ncbi:MAG: VWA domain-containing protein [Oligoflexia bacterium]|nr:VWA domain-containing protein [Oligoflexia bacterium]